MPFKNNTTRFLDSQHVDYQVHEYRYDADASSAMDVAAAVGLPPERVFKTLVVLPNEPRRKPMLVAIPGSQTLDLRAFSKQVGVKKAKMASHDEAESLTGLQTGGISPLALINKGFDVYLDASAEQLDTIAISAGERGAQVELGVGQLVKLTRARMIEL